MKNFTEINRALAAKKNFLINRALAAKKNFNLLKLLALFVVLITSINTSWADDADVADIGGIFSVNGSTEKYKIATKADYLTCSACTDWSIRGWTSFSGHNFGNVSSFKLKGVAVSGWATSGKSDWFAAKIFYKIYASGASEPGSNTGDFGVGHYGQANLGNTSDMYKCDKCYENDGSIKKVIGMDNQNVDLIGDRDPGVYNIKVFTNTQSLWNNGSGGSDTYLQKNDYAAVTATFTVMPKVTFDADGGSLGTTTQYVTYNSSTALSSISTLGLTPPTGYHFDHWEDGSSNQYNNGASVNLTANLSLTAHYLPNTTTVTLNKNGATSGSNQTVVATYDAAMPTTTTSSTTVTAPSRTGYTFGGFYDTSASSGGTQYYTNAANPASARTWNKDVATSILWARWTADTYTAANNLQKNNSDAAGSAHGKYTATYNSSTIAINTTPTRKGYYIEGFYKEEGCTNKIADASGNLQANTDYTDGNGKWNVTSNQTLYVKWVPSWYMYGGGEELGSWTQDWSGGAMTYSASNTVSKTLTLTAGQRYYFKIWKHGGATAWSNSTSVKNITSSTTSDRLYNNDNNNMDFTASASGDYTFTLAISDESQPHLTITYPTGTTYTVTHGSRSYYVSGTNAISTTGGSVAAIDNYGKTLGSGKKIFSGGSVVFTASPATGYTFEGWYSNNTCTTPIVHNGTTIVINEGAKTLTLSSIGENKTVYAKFVEKSATVTIRANDTGRGSITVAAAAFSWGSSTTIGKTTTKALVITPATGYYLAGWDFSAGADFELQDQSDSEDETVTLAGLGGTNGSTGTLTARFEPLDKIYFRNENATNGAKLWNDDMDANVYVFFDAYWDGSSKGAGGNGKPHATMSKIGESNIYMAYVPRSVTKAGYTKVAFSSRGWINDENFYGGGFGAFRGDYNRILNMYVPHHNETNNLNSGVSYNNNGYWMKYDTKKNEGAGYYWQRFTTSPSNQYIQVAEMVATEDNATTLKFKITIDNVSNDTYIIRSAGGLKYWPKVGESVQTITSANCTNLNLFEDNGTWPAFEFAPTVKGDYIFTLDQTGDVMKFSVQYPEAPAAANDYRLKHTYTRDAVTYTTYSNVIKSGVAGSSNPVSMYLSTEGTETLVLQKCTGIVAGEPAWTAGDATNLSGVTTAVGEDKGVYVFNISINTSTHKVSAATTPTLYTGDYYLHANATSRNNLAMGEPKTGSAVGNKFTKFLKNSSFGDSYDYYWVDWFIGTADGGGAQSVAATIGNDYNDDLAGKVGSGESTTTDGANVRYAYDSESNAFTCKMISGGGSDIKIINTVRAEDVKILVGENYLDAYNTERSATDADNWMYSFTAKVKPSSTASIKTTYNAVTTTLASDKKLLGGSGESAYDVEISYDFKTNRLIASWIPSTVSEPISLESNMMVVRSENDNPTVLNLTGTGALNDITQIYTVMEFNKATWASSNRTIVGGGYTDAYYWISLPYDCNISDIFGIDNYGDWWVIQTYHGDYRARDGWWAETANWWYNMGRDGVMKANQGYVLRLTNLANYGAPFYSGGTINKLHLYFPSSNSEMVNIVQLGDSKVTTLDPLPCNKWNKNNSEPNNGEGNPEWDRRAEDSNWRLIGSPSFNSTKIEESLTFFYAWDVSAGSARYTATDATTTELKATQAYMVQYAGDITWKPYNASNPLVGAPARKLSENKNQTIRLVLNRNEEQADVTFISRMEEGATEGYDLNLDLSKMINKRNNNIYTKAGYYKMAGNCLPDTVKMVPVGVQLYNAGEYTFSMPDGANGVGVTLVDKVANIRTNLALMDYTVSLEAGTNDERFVLELSPIKNTPTGIEAISDQNSAVRKVIVDGALYIIRDGDVFDARGTRVK